MPSSVSSLSVSGTVGGLKKSKKVGTRVLLTGGRDLPLGAFFF